MKPTDVDRSSQLFLKGWNAGRQDALLAFVSDLIGQHTDKEQVLLALYRKAQHLGETDPDNTMLHYAEGLRAGLAILKTRGPALDAYRDIINRNIFVPMAEEEVSKWT